MKKKKNKPYHCRKAIKSQKASKTGKKVYLKQKCQRYGVTYPLTVKNSLVNGLNLTIETSRLIEWVKKTQLSSVYKKFTGNNTECEKNRKLYKSQVEMKMSRDIYFHIRKTKK